MVLQNWLFHERQQVSATESALASATDAKASHEA
jgi:hypothetical protein